MPAEFSAGYSRGNMNTSEAAAPVETPTPFYLTFLWACNLGWTLVLLGMNVREFLQKGQWAYQGPGSLIYFATLAAYAGAKETHQWTQGESQAEMKGRKGILFVGVWVVFSMGTFVAVNLDQGYVFPHELLTVTLEVLGIFFGTQASKALRQRKVTAIKALSLEDGILQLAKDAGGAGTSLITDRLGADRNAVQYALRKLVKDGKLRKVGDNSDPDTKYQVV